MSTNPSDSNALGSFIASEVTRAEQIFQNFRSRALNLITTSGGLVTLVSGLLAIAIGTQNSVVPIAARWTISISLASFIISAICALLINKPAKISSSDEKYLKKYVENDWDAEGWGKSVAAQLVVYLASLRNNNVRTSKLLTTSIALQISGISFIAITAFLVLLHAG